MNSSSNPQVSSFAPPNSTTSISKQYSQPQRRFVKSWQLIPLLVTPLVVAGSFYLSNQQVSQAQQNLAAERAENQQAIARSQQEIEDAQNQLSVLQQKYQDTQAQLQAIQSQKADLQGDYTDAVIRLDSLELQNQQLKPLETERDTLKAQVKQLQQSNATLKNQGKTQVEQTRTLQNRIKTLENQKKQLYSDNQKLQQAASKLEALKPELAKAHRTIELLTLQLGKKSDEMATINLNGQAFTVTSELAAALRTEQKRISNQAERPTTEQQSPVAVNK